MTLKPTPQGLALAYSIYSPVYGATSPYIRGTVRNDPLFIQAGAAIWLVRALPFLHLTPTERLPARSFPKSLTSSLIFSSVISDLQEAANAPFPKDMASASSLSRTTSLRSLGGWSSRCSREATLVRAVPCSSSVCSKTMVRGFSVDFPLTFDVSDVRLGC
jgi:hypothetical protein